MARDEDGEPQADEGSAATIAALPSSAAGRSPRDAARVDRGPGAGSSAAFAATIAPASLPGLSPLGTAGPDVARPSISAAGSGTTAPGELPPLPTVPSAHYRADREIARGGMGRIVAAEDQRLGRRVALKELLEPAGDQLGRFQREALITARLQHPGIVPVYEAGRWPTGEPFFAMKLVSGRPLDRVIADARTMEQRLALLPRVAAATDAIAYAHSQRVIHRDLKPANILIGDFGETVVIDWGLAKDLDATEASLAPNLTMPATSRAKRASLGPRNTDGEETIDGGAAPRPRTISSTSGATLTVAGAVMGTPAYMAPEQARGEALDQRADVFALGAMLYHLLAGTPPYNARTATDVIAAAASSKVVPLAERERGAPADLVAIVNRAMAALPVDRYADAGELATELRRFLTGQLVAAHHYTAAQRVARFVRKHRGAVTIAALATIVVAAGSAFAVRRIVHERDIAEQQRKLADTRRVAAEKLIDKMLSDVKDQLSQIGRLDLLTSLGGEIRDYYGTLAKIPGGMPADDVDRMAIAVDLVGLAERESGAIDHAQKTWSGMRAQLAGIVGADLTTATSLKRRIIAHLDFELGTTQQQRGQIAAAVATYTLAKQEFATLRAEAPLDRAVMLASAETHDRLGDLARNEGKIDEAFEEYGAAKAEREAASAVGGNARPSEEVLALSTSHVKLGSVYQARGESATALEEYRAALRLRETLRAQQPDNVEVQERVLDVTGTLADLQRALGDDRGSVATYREALPTMDALARRDPSNTTWKRQRGNFIADLGFALLDSGDFAGGLAQLDTAIETQRSLAERDPKSTTWQGDLSRSDTRAGDGELYSGNPDRAIERYLRALAIRQALVEIDPKSAPYRRSVAWSYAKLANAYAFKGDAAQALASLEQAYELRSALAREAPNQSGFKSELAQTEAELARAIAAKNPARAVALADGGVARARALVAADPINLDMKQTLVEALLARAAIATDAKAREALLTEALGVAQPAVAKAPQNAHWPGWLAEVLAGLGQWRGVRDVLEPLAKANRLPAPRKALLDRARAAAP